MHFRLLICDDNSCLICAYGGSISSHGDFFEGIGVVDSIIVRLAQVIDGQSPTSFLCHRIGLGRITGVSIRIHTLCSLPCRSFQINLDGIRQRCIGLRVRRSNHVPILILPDLVHCDRGGLGQLLVGYGDGTGLDTGGTIAVGNAVPRRDSIFLEVIVITHGVAVFVRTLQGQTGEGVAPFPIIRKIDGLINFLRGGFAAAVRFGGGRRNIRFIITIGNTSRIGIVCRTSKLRISRNSVVIYIIVISSTITTNSFMVIC